MNSNLQMILLACCLLAIGPSFSQEVSRTVFPDLQIGGTVTIKSKFEGQPVVEPHLSAHPSDPWHLLAAAMVVTDISNPYQSSRLSSFVSEDGGLTWQETAHDYWGYDPWTAILPDGQTAMGWLGTKGSFNHQFPIQFFSSADGGRSWSQGVQTENSPHGHDGVKIAAGNNKFYFTSVRFRDDMGADVVVYSRQNHLPFKYETKVNSRGVRLNFCEPAILLDGSVLIPSSYYLEKVWVQRYLPETGEMSGKNLITFRPGGNRGYMRMASDRNPESPFADRVYFLRASDGVWLNYSTDKGNTWSADIRVDQFSSLTQSHALVPSVAINKNGVIGISWIDSQQKTDKYKKDLFFSLSTDGGNTFISPVRITKQSTDPRTSKNGDVANKFPGGGHYLNIVAKANGAFQLIWSDSRSGVFELQTCEVQINGR